MNITTEMIKGLREATGAGVLEAKKVLTETDGNFDKAVDLLRQRGMAKAEKRADRDAKEGIVELYAHPGNRVGVILELNCETDFVARNEQFRQLAHDLALQVAASNPRYLRIEDVPASALERELGVLRAQALAEGKPEAMVDKIIAGRLNKFYEEICLLEQPFIKDDKRKIKDLLSEAVRMIGENIIIRRFARYELGEAL